MNSDFRLVALPRERFAQLFDLGDDELARHGARRMVVDASPGFPCRVSLEDAALGERVILMPFRHHDVASPYRAEGPIFVRELATTARLAPNEIPPMLQRRLLSLRAYDGAGFMRDAMVCEGRELDQAIRGLFRSAAIDYLHVHNAKPGCFNCAIVRA